MLVTSGRRENPLMSKRTKHSKKGKEIQTLVWTRVRPQNGDEFSTRGFIPL
jgi:hypothetical protein